MSRSAKKFSFSIAVVGLTACFLGCTVAPAATTLGKRKVASAKDAGSKTALPKLPGDPTMEDPPTIDPQPNPEVDAGTPDPIAEQDASTPQVIPDAAPLANAPTWTTIYSSYFGPGTLGHCSGQGCHTAVLAGFACGNSATSCYQGLVSAGLVSAGDPTHSSIGAASSPLTWFGQGGNMPIGGSANSAAATAIQAWVQAGALEN